MDQHNSDMTEVVDVVVNVLTDADLLSHILRTLGMQGIMRVACVCSTWHLACTCVLKSWCCLTLEHSKVLRGAPCLLASAATGRLLTTEAVGARMAHVCVLSPSLDLLHTIGGRCPEEPRLARPTGVAATDDGEFIFIADAEMGRLQRYSLTTGETCTIRPPSLGRAFTWQNSWDPYGIAMKPQPGGDPLLFLADSRWHRIVMLRGACNVKPDVTVASHWGQHGDAEGEFDHPRGLAVEPKTALLWVCDRGNDRIQIFTASGRFVRQLGGHGTAPGRMRGPYALVFIADGRAVVSEFEGRRVQVFGVEDGAPLQTLTLPLDVDSNRFPCPTGLALHGEDCLVVGQFTGEAKLHVYRVARVLHMDGCCASLCALSVT